eukprot:363973-Chlamydomonas_euryale.AAC.3
MCARSDGRPGPAASPAAEANDADSDTAAVRRGMIQIEVPAPAAAPFGTQPPAGPMPIQRADRSFPPGTVEPAVERGMIELRPAAQQPEPSVAGATGSDGGGGGSPEPEASAHGEHEASGKPKQSLRQVYGVLASSVPLQCLAVMSLAQVTFGGGGWGWACPST